MPPAPFALDAAADASLASLGSLGDVRRHGGHHRNLSAIPELDESGEGSGGAVARTAAGTAPWWPAVAPTRAAAAAAAAPQPSPELAQPLQLQREQLRRPSPPSAGRSIATQAFYTAASEAPVALMDENSCACTSDSPETRHAAAAAAAAYKSTAAAAYKSTAAAAGVHSQGPAGQAAQHSTTLCGITRQAPGRRQSDMAGDLVRGVGESLPSGRHTSRPGTAAMVPLSAAAQPVPARGGAPSVAHSAARTAVPAAWRPAAAPAGPLERSPGRKRAAAQLSAAASGAPAAKVAAHAVQPPSRGGSSAAEPPPTAAPVPPLAPALAPQPSDPDTQPLAAGLFTLPSFRSWAASGSRGSLAASGLHRRSRSLGSGLDDLRREASSGGSSRRGSASGGAALPGPVPQNSTEVTFMPLGHQGSKWSAGAELSPAGTPCGAAAVAAVPVLTRSTVAALLGETPPPPPQQQQQTVDACMPCRPSAGAEDRSWVYEGTDESAGAGPSYSPAYRPWTAVRRVIDEVGRQAGAPLGSHRQPGQSGAAGAAPPGWGASADSTSTVVMPWDQPPVPRSAGGAASSAHQPADGHAQRSMRRPPRPPSSRAGAAAAPMQVGRQAAQPRVRLQPPSLPPPPYEARAWSTSEADDFAPLFSSALSQSQRARPRQQAAAAQHTAKAPINGPHCRGASMGYAAKDAASSPGLPLGAVGQASGGGVRAALARLLLGQRRRTVSQG